MSARRGRHPEQALFAFAEERDARRRGLDELFAALGAFRAGGRFLRLLACMGRFRDYGPYNALLAAVQRPEAVCILPPSKWRAYNREVKPTARPIVLLRPFSPVTCVFDLADTRVIRGRMDRFPPEAAAPDVRTPCRAVPEVVVRRLLARLPWWGILHETVPTGPATAGEIHLADGTEGPLAVPVREGGVVPWRPVYVLRTRAGVSSTDLFAALVHALARLFCHHLRSGYEMGWGAGRALTAEVEAFEADVALWIVSRRQNVASPAYAALDAYFATHAAVPEGASVDAVLDAVAQVEALLGDACTVRDGFLARYAPAFAARLRADGRGGDALHGDFQQETTTT